MEKGWVKIYSTDKQHLVTIVRELLEENEIASTEVGRKDSTFPMMSDTEIYVREKDAILARTIILQHNL
jgi:hypothetical protein